MIDPSVLASNIQGQISSTVDRSIREYLGNVMQEMGSTWVEKIEQQIRECVVDRFGQQIEQVSIDNLIASAVEMSLQQIIDPSVEHNIHKQIFGTVDQSIEKYVDQIIQALSLDSAWIKKIEQQINDNISRKFTRKLALVDVDSLMAQSMDDAITRYYDRQPKKQTGISDQAQQPELIVSDQCVTIQNHLQTSRLTVDTDAVVSGSLTVQNIAIRGFINTDNKSWQQLVSDLSNTTLAKLDEEWRHQLVAEVKKEITDEGINFHEVNIAGVSLIKDGHLNDSITTSNLKSVGALDQLCVRGSVDMCDSLSIRSKRVGINTQHPDMALSVWDEEVSLAFGKHKQQTAYLGTLKPQAMIIGINRQPAIDINEQGRVIINHLTVGRHRVCHEAEIPNYSGTKGDIVFNSNPRGDGVWAWQCLGAFKWQPLRSA